MARISNSESDFHSRSAVSYSSAQIRNDALVQGTVSQAMDFRSLAAMSMGSLAFTVARTASIPLLNTLLRSASSVRSSSWGLALFAEVATFRASNQILHSQSPEAWNDPRAFASTLMDFMALKEIGHFLRSENIFIRYFSQSTGMVTGEWAGEKLHLRDASALSLGERYGHALASVIALEAGGNLSQAFTGFRLRRLEQNLHQHTQSYTFDCAAAHSSEFANLPRMNSGSKDLTLQGLRRANTHLVHVDANPNPNPSEAFRILSLRLETPPASEPRALAVGESIEYAVVRSIPDIVILQGLHIGISGFADWSPVYRMAQSLGFRNYVCMAESPWHQFSRRGIAILFNPNHDRIMHEGFSFDGRSDGLSHGVLNLEYLDRKFSRPLTISAACLEPNRGVLQDSQRARMAEHWKRVARENFLIANWNLPGPLGAEMANEAGLRLALSEEYETAVPEGASFMLHPVFKVFNLNISRREGSPRVQANLIEVSPRLHTHVKPYGDRNLEAPITLLPPKELERRSLFQGGEPWKMLQELERLVSISDSSGLRKSLKDYRLDWSNAQGNLALDARLKEIARDAGLHLEIRTEALFILHLSRRMLPDELLRDIFPLLEVLPQDLVVYEDSALNLSPKYFKALTEILEALDASTFSPESRRLLTQMEAHTNPIIRIAIARSRKASIAALLGFIADPASSRMLINESVRSLGRHRQLEASELPRVVLALEDLQHHPSDWIAQSASEAHEIRRRIALGHVSLLDELGYAMKVFRQSSDRSVPERTLIALAHISSVWSWAERRSLQHSSQAVRRFLEKEGSRGGKELDRSDRDDNKPPK